MSAKHGCYVLADLLGNTASAVDVGYDENPASGLHSCFDKRILADITVEAVEILHE